MPFQDIIDDYTLGATGSIATTDGGTVGCTVSGTAANVGWNNTPDGARVNANDTQTLEIGFDRVVTGLTVTMSGSDSNEFYHIEINGSKVNLADLVASGDVTFTQTVAATHTLNADGTISGGHHSDQSVAELQFNIPAASIRIFGSGGTPGNWDVFEVGINSASFTAVCFANGTMIETKTGQRAVEDIQEGDRVMMVLSRLRSGL